MKARKRIPQVSAKRLKKFPSLAYSSSTIVRQSSGPNKRSAKKRKAKPRQVNARRRKSEFARTYHSRARVAFIKSLPCCVCVGITARSAIGLFIASALEGQSDNAHTGERSGMGRKAGYETIVPMCRTHHRRFDTYLPPFFIDECREAIQALAPKIEALWLAQGGAS